MRNHHREGKKESSAPIMFGVGSYTFFVDLEDPKEMSEIVVSFSEALRNIPGLTALRIEQEFDAPNRLLSGKNQLKFLQIDFDLNLNSDPEFQGGLDKFKFTSKPFYDVPVTLVISEQISEVNDASMGVMKVREYLKKYLKGKFSLDIIGPSPFHADFTLIRDASNFELDIKEQRGYDLIYIYATSTTRDAAIKEFLNEVGNELNLFYLIREVEVDRINMWSDVQEKLDILHNDRTTNWVQPFINWILQGSRFSQVMEAVIVSETMTLSAKQMIDDRFESTQSKYLLPYIEREKKGMYVYPVESIKNLLDFRASQAAQFNQNLVTFLNTLASIALTAAVTYLFYKIGIGK